MALADNKGAAVKKVGNLGNPGIAPPQSMPYGKSYAEWSAAWWQWALALPVTQNPFFDGATEDTYGQCQNGANGQSGPVWFLAGVINVSGTAVRACTVPTGKALFFPVINSECSTIEDPPFHGDNYQELAECAPQYHAGGLFAEIDGVPVKNLESYFFLSPMFDVQIPADNVWGKPGPATGKSVSYGSWLMVRPLSRGTHVIHFGGTYTDYDFTLDITYILNVQ